MMLWKRVDNHLWVLENGKDFDFNDVVSYIVEREKKEPFWEKVRVLENIYLGMDDYMVIKENEGRRFGYFDLTARKDEAVYVERNYFWYWRRSDDGRMIPWKVGVYIFSEKKGLNERYAGIRGVGAFDIARSREMAWHLVGKNGVDAAERKFAIIPKVLICWESRVCDSYVFDLFNNGNLIFKHYLKDGTPCLVTLNLKRWASCVEDENGELMLNQLEELEDLIIKFRLGGD